MSAADILATVAAAGVRLRAEGNQLLASPRERLTEELRTLIRANKPELLTALSKQPEPAHANGGSPGHQAEAPKPAPERGTDCMRCANLTMRVEHHEGTRRVFWWRCKKGHALMEGRNFGERVLLAPPECDAAGDFLPWQPGQ